MKSSIPSISSISSIPSMPSIKLCWVLLNRIENYYFYLAVLIIGFFFIVNLNVEMAMTLVTGTMIFLVAKKGKLHEVLSHTCFQYLGKISYSLYLTHWPIGIMLISLLFFIFGPYAHAMHSLVLMMITVSITLLVSHFFYKYVEYPSIKLCKKLGKGSSQNKKNLLKECKGSPF